MAKILVADDELHIRNLIKLILHEHQVIEASDGNDALNKFKADRPDLVILDLIMPNMNGIDACKKLRAMPEGRNAKIIMLSAKTLSELKDMPDIDADDMITKPFDPEELRKKIDNLLN